MKNLELSEGKKVKIWANSAYAFNVVYVHEVIWKERGLPTVQGQKGGHWLSLIHMPKYQTFLLEQEDVELKATTSVNPAQFLNIPMQGEEHLTHGYLQTIEYVYASQPDLQDASTEDPEIEFFTDRSSFVKDGK
ncbi:hypothetical protein HGM15179_018145 [Zosterops borbonicus]|uniref:Uncharacterized protein n=1 Tax=Zosterops borbonicus TaxID=364589 RepID=A0A8K1FZJ2_9PASS|nr:hypothetical protein HGM15179_018145 [Zosterops borbonicus]